MPLYESTPEHQQYLITGLQPGMLRAVAEVVTALGAQIEPVEPSNQVLRKIQTVNLDDFYRYAEQSAKTDLEKQRNPVSARALWRRSQELVAAREAHKKDIAIPIVTKYNNRIHAVTPLPRTSPLVFTETAPLPIDHSATAKDYLDWSTNLDNLTITSLVKQAQLVKLYGRGDEQNPLGVGIAAVRSKFYLNLIEHLKNKS